MRCLKLLALLSLTGCSGISIYARATAGHIGCPAEQIEVLSAQDDEPGPRSWVAACGGKQYACSSSGSLEDNHSRITCAAVGEPPKPG